MKHDEFTAGLVLAVFVVIVAVVVFVLGLRFPVAMVTVLVRVFPMVTLPPVVAFVGMCVVIPVLIVAVAVMGMVPRVVAGGRIVATLLPVVLMVARRFVNKEDPVALQRQKARVGRHPDAAKLRDGLELRETVHVQPLGRRVRDH
jgi:hypothetical protein